MKMYKFGTKSASFGYFWARILKKLDITTFELVQMQNSVKK